jgi:hypothetical protein
MITDFSAVLLWLFVITLGIAFGAGLYEQRVVVSQWLSSSTNQREAHWHGERARQDDPGRKFWGFVSTIPLTLITLANLYAAWHAAGIVRGPWLAAAIIELAGRVFTFSYFIPTMVRLMNVDDSPAAVATASRWRNLNYVRLAIGFAAWIFSLRAFSFFYQQRG